MPEQYGSGSPIIIPAARYNVRSTVATTDAPTTQDAIILTNNAAGTAVNLPTAVSVGSGFRLTVVNVGSSGTTTVNPSEGPPDDTVNGTDAGYTTGLTTQWGAVVFVSDGVSNWIAIAGL